MDVSRPSCHEPRQPVSGRDSLRPAIEEPLLVHLRLHPDHLEHLGRRLELDDVLRRFRKHDLPLVDGGAFDTSEPIGFVAGIKDTDRFEA